jgi:O-antigen ligase/Tfp pilus assembly protein PilF
VNPIALVTLGLLFLLPVLFTPGQLTEEFELPKSALLAAGGLLLLAWWIALESSLLTAAGVGRWLAAVPGRIGAAIRRDPLGGAVAFMLLSAVVSTLASVRPPLSLYGAPQSHAGLRTVAALAAIYYASRALAGNPVWFRRVAQASGLAAAVAAAYSLLQIAHLDPITWSRQSSFGGLIRSGSTVGHANTLSAYLVTCLPLTAWLATRARSRGAAVAWIALAGASLFIVVASLSRGAWLGAAAGAVTAAVLALASGRRPSRRTSVIAAIVLAIALVVPLVTPMRAAVLTRVSQIGDTRAETSRTRVELWRSGLRMFGDHPVTGVGLDAFVAAFPPYRTAELTRLEWGGTPAKAHNDAIQILSTQGALGGLAALAIVILILAALWRIARRAGVEGRSAAIAAGAALAAYAASSLVGFGTVAASGLAAALAGWIGRTAGPAESHAPQGGGVRIWGVALGIASAAVLGHFLIQRPLRAEIILASALHHPTGDRARDSGLEMAAASAPWDPRYPAEVGRSYFYEALHEQDAPTRLGLLALARSALERSVAIAPENSENRILYATALSAQWVLKPGLATREQVRDEFRRAVALDPLSPTVLVGAERGLIAAGLPEEARPLALRCARAYPDYASPLADLGAIALEQGRNADAADTLKLALRQQWREDVAGIGNAWNDLAKASLALGDAQQAEVAADSVLARNPNMLQAFALKQDAIRMLAAKKTIPTK